MIDLVFVTQDCQAGGRSLLHWRRWPWWSSGLRLVELLQHHYVDGEGVWRLAGVGPCGAVACHCQVTAHHGQCLPVHGANCEYHGSKEYVRDVFGRAPFWAPSIPGQRITV